MAKKQIVLVVLDDENQADQVFQLVKSSTIATFHSLVGSDHILTLDKETAVVAKLASTKNKIKLFFDENSDNIRQHNQGFGNNEPQKQIEELQKSLQDNMTLSAKLDFELDQMKNTVFSIQEEYEIIKETNHKLLWEYIPSHSPEIRSVPKIVNTEENETNICNYKIGKMIGEGHYAGVYACSSFSDSNLAVKILDKSKITDINALKRINAEIKVLSDIQIKDVPGIISIKDVIHTCSHIYIITERGGDDLFDHFEKYHDGVPEPIILKFFQGIVPPLYILHLNNYCHRDLKPENILISKDENEIKLIDFGLSHKLSTSNTMLHDFCGSPGFFAPEILCDDSYDGKKADIWSIGCIVLELIIGHEFFASRWMNSYAISNLRNKKKFKNALEESVKCVHELLDTHQKFEMLSTKLKVLLKSILQIDPKNRCTIEDIKETGWLNIDKSKSQNDKIVKPKLHPHIGSINSRQARSATNIVTLPALPT